MKKQIRFKYLGIWSDWMDFEQFTKATRNIFNEVAEVEERFYE